MRLAKKHTGMRVSADGLLGRIAAGQKPDKGQRYMLDCMLGHLRQMADRYYAGDETAVDEFLQLYALDDGRPTQEA